MAAILLGAGITLFVAMDKGIQHYQRKHNEFLYMDGQWVSRYEPQRAKDGTIVNRREVVAYAPRSQMEKIDLEELVPFPRIPKDDGVATSKRYSQQQNSITTSTAGDDHSNSNNNSNNMITISRSDTVIHQTIILLYYDDDDDAGQKIHRLFKLTYIFDVECPVVVEKEISPLQFHFHGDDNICRIYKERNSRRKLYWQWAWRRLGPKEKRQAVGVAGAFVFFACVGVVKTALFILPYL